MNVDPSQIQGYQRTTRTVTNEDGTTRQEAVGSVPIENTTAMQRAIFSSGQGVTRDDNNIYVPLNQNGQPEKYIQKVSFTAREKHMKQLNEMAARPQPQGSPPQDPQPQNTPDSSQPPLPNGSVQTEPTRSPTVNPRTQPAEAEPPKHERQIDKSQPPQVDTPVNQSQPPEVEVQIDKSQPPQIETHIDQSQPQETGSQINQPQPQEPIPQTGQSKPSSPPVEYDDPSLFSPYVPEPEGFSFFENEVLEPNGEDLDLNQFADEIGLDF